MRPIGPSLLLVLGHMFISKAHSDNQRIDYHLTYPSSPRVFSLAYGVAETNNSKIWSSRGGRQISALVFKERKNALDVAHSCRSSTSCPSNCKVLVMILPASCIYCFHMQKHLGNIIAQHNFFFLGKIISEENQHACQYEQLKKRSTEVRSEYSILNQRSEMMMMVNIIDYNRVIIW